MNKLLASFDVSCQPLPKQRPRVVDGHAYTPQRTLDYEAVIGWHASLVIDTPLQGDLHVSVHFYREGKRRADLDNLLKAVLDGCNEIVYQDDKQIVQLSSRVTYGCKKDKGGVVVKVYSVDLDEE